VKVLSVLCLLLWVFCIFHLNRWLYRLFVKRGSDITWIIWWSISTLLIVVPTVKLFIWVIHSFR